MEYFSIIQALCRSALSSPSNAIVHQIERLKSALEKDGHVKEAKSLAGLLTLVDKTCDMSPSRIQRSFLLNVGEELTSKILIPVDKETSTPLAEIFFADDLPDESPLFNQQVGKAIESIINEWRSYEDLVSIQAQPSRSCLIYGPPGTGKTHLALWLAKQIGLPVVLAKLDGLMSSFLGTTSRNIGNLFSFANKYRCVLLLDEFDAIAKLRNDSQEVGEIKRVVNSLLQNLDGRKKSGFTIGVTNHETLLDPAIWRRFEVQLEVPRPSIETLHSIIKKFLEPMQLEEHELDFLVWVINGATGADAISLAMWIKKSQVLDAESRFIDIVKKFVVLNSGRVSNEIRNILTHSDDEKLITRLLGDPSISFKQKDVATLLHISPSVLSKNLSKSKENDKK